MERTIKTRNMTFEVKYDEGGICNIEKGVLVEVTEDKKLRIHLGVNEAAELIAVGRGIAEMMFNVGLGPAFMKEVVEEAEMAAKRPEGDMGAVIKNASQAYKQHRAAIENWTDGDIAEVWFEEKVMCIKYQSSRWFHYKQENEEWVWW